MSVPRSALMLTGRDPADDAAAAACAGSLETRGFSTETRAATRLAGRLGGSAGAVRRIMLRVPGATDALHFTGAQTGSRLARLGDAAAGRLIVPRLRSYLDSRPADLVISFCAVGASAVSRLARRYPGMSHVVVCTDAMPQRLWVHPNVDLYLVMSAVAEAAVLRYEPSARILEVPAPVRPAFYRAPPQAAARGELAVPQEESCVLLLAEGWAPRAIVAGAEALGRAGLHVLVAAERDAPLLRRLAPVAARQPRVRALDSAGRMPDLMAAADLVICSSGGTCAEARVVGRPLLLLDVIPGPGRSNLQHELERGDAWVTSPAAADLVASALATLSRIKPAVTGPASSPDAFEVAVTAALATVG